MVVSCCGGWAVVVVPWVVAPAPVDPVFDWAPPPTLPFAAICCWIYCLSSGESAASRQALSRCLLSTRRVLAHWLASQDATKALVTE